MKRNGKRFLFTGMVMMLLFAVWTVLIQTVDVQTAGQNGTDIGFAALNVWFHKTRSNFAKI
jgi:undecaprenyl-diphosphatase